MPPSTSLLLDGHPYTLAGRPLTTSPLARTARSTLPSETPTATLRALLAEHPANPPPTARALRAILAAAESALSEQHHVVDLLHAHPSHAVDALSAHAALANDAKSLAATVSTLHLARAALHNAALHAVNTRVVALRTRRTELIDSLTDIRAQKAAHWETHFSLLETLSDAGAAYTRTARLERAAARRANMAGLVSFVEHIDAYAQTRLNITLFRPVVEAVRTSREEAVARQIEKRALVDVKRRHRDAYRAALDAFQTCDRQARETQGELVKVDDEVRALHTDAQRLARTAVCYVRLAGFWGLLAEGAGRIGSQQLAGLVTACMCAAEPDEQEGDIDVSDVSDIAVPAAIKRRVVMCFAQWVALSDLCRECLTELIEGESGVEEAEDVSVDVASRRCADLVSEVQRTINRTNRDNAELSHDLDAGIKSN